LLFALEFISFELNPYVNIALMMEAVSTLETTADFCQATRRNNPEDSHLHEGVVVVCS
jgi:hypothetical protein